MTDTAHTTTLAAADVAALAQNFTAPNGIRYATYGEISGDPASAAADLPRLVQTVPVSMTPALAQTVFDFVPLALTATGDAESLDRRGPPAFIAPAYSADLADRAICHRNVKLDGHEGVFLSSRLHNDRFALAFEFFINVSRGFVDIAGVPEEFSTLVWLQAQEQVRGETSHDAWEYRAKAMTGDEKARTAYMESTFVDALAIYQLSLYLDFDYIDLREREYALLTPAALADRLRVVAVTLPPNAGYQFEIRYRRR